MQKNNQDKKSVRKLIWRLNKQNNQSGRKRKKSKKRRHVFLGIVLFFAIFLAGTGISLYPAYAELREDLYDALTQMDESSFVRAGNTEIYDTEGNLIGRIGNEKYEYLEIQDIPEYVTKGYIATEDRQFYTHMGVDLKATFRAAIVLVKNQGKITQGGSTITQQVVKNCLLTQEQTYKRKILEILLSFEMEKQYNKAEIMEFYCNTCYYGESCYGIEGASEYYFGKKASKMTLAEAAMLVGTSNSPNNYNPVADYELAMKKKKEVLGNMFECGYITQEEYDSAVLEEPDIVQKTEEVDADSYQITYAIHCAALELMKLDEFPYIYLFDSSEEYETYSEKYDEAYSEVVAEIRGGGYTIYTSLDTKLQEKLQEAVDKNLSEFTEKQGDGRYAMQGAAVCIDNETQMVAAVVGGRGEEDSYNRGYQAKRQPGSCIKPLLDHGPALNEGIVTPGTVLPDERITINGYSPRNSGDHYYGNVTVREALGRSLNTIALKLFHMTGKDTCLSYLEKLHFSSLEYADTTIASVSIGGFTQGVTVSDMARGYATLANGGKYSSNTCIQSIEHYMDGLIYECDNEESSVYTADTAFMLTDMLQGVLEESYGTAHKMMNNEQHYAGKTGTTNDSKDAWFCGYSAYYTTAVWVGYDMPRAVDGLYGSTYPGTIWKDFMDEIHEGLEKQDFEIPETIKLKSSSGTKDVNYSKNVFSSRPSGWDYYSTLTEEKVKQAEEARKEEEMQNTAEKAVTSFENFQITSISDAESLDGKYQEVVDTISDVGDSSVRSELMKRAAYKYDLLNDAVEDTWKEAIQESESAAEKQKDAENVEEAQKSLEKAEQIKKESLESLAEWYIDHLNQRTLYSDYTAQMILDGEQAVRACSNLDSYESLKAAFEQAKAYAETLPTQQYSNIVVETPDESDYPDVESSENSATSSSDDIYGDSYVNDGQR